MGRFDFRFTGEGVTPAGRPFSVSGWQARQGDVIAQEIILSVLPGEGEPNEQTIPGTDQTVPLGPARMLNRKVIQQEDGSWKRVVGGGDEAGPVLVAAHHERFLAEGRVQASLDRHDERVEVDVQYAAGPFLHVANVDGRGAAEGPKGGPR